jgi:hypothetical protein
MTPTAELIATAISSVERFDLRTDDIESPLN